MESIDRATRVTRDGRDCHRRHWLSILSDEAGGNGNKNNETKKKITNVPFRTTDATRDQ